MMMMTRMALMGWGCFGGNGQWSQRKVGNNGGWVVAMLFY
jgi:hypothetical protein